MDINYLLSILDLYLLKESNDHLIIEVHDNNIIKVECSYASSNLNKTFVKINKNIFFDNINFIINKIQGNLNIKNELLDNGIYKVIFDNNREINFIKFSNNDLEKIRSNFKNVTNNFTFNKVKINETINKKTTYDEIYKLNKKRNLNFSLGFSSFITIFLTSIWFLDIFMIALWIFKALK